MMINKIHNHCPTGLGHTHKYSVKLPMFQQKNNNEVHEYQHTLILQLDMQLTEPRDVHGNAESQLKLT